MADDEYVKVPRPNLGWLAICVPIVVWLVFSALSSSTGEAWFKLIDILVKVGGGALVIYGLYLTNRRIQISDRQAHTAARQVQAIEDGQVTERFTKAIEQLGASRDGEPNLEVRLGGIFALERIARDSEKDHWTVMEVLSAYVRENAPRARPKEETPESSELMSLPESLRPRVDIQAALTVIGRREEREEPGHIDLRKADLGCCDLRGANLKGANLWKAGLWGAFLMRANMRKTTLQEASLKGAYMDEAKLEGAILWDADLDGARLWRAILSNANLQGAFLRKAFLHTANLQATHLAGAILEGAKLQMANLQGASLDGANLQEAIMYQADLEEASLLFANLQRADLWGAENLTKEQLAKAIIDESTKLPDHLEDSRDELLRSSESNLEELVRLTRKSS